MSEEKYTQPGIDVHWVANDIFDKGGEGLSKRCPSCFGHVLEDFAA